MKINTLPAETIEHLNNFQKEFERALFGGVNLESHTWTGRKREALKIASDKVWPEAMAYLQSHNDALASKDWGRKGGAEIGRFIAIKMAHVVRRHSAEIKETMGNNVAGWVSAFCKFLSENDTWPLDSVSASMYGVPPSDLARVRANWCRAEGYSSLIQVDHIKRAKNEKKSKSKTSISSADMDEIVRRVVSALKAH